MHIPSAERGDAVLVDVSQFVDKRGTALTFTREILSNTADKKSVFLDALVCTNGLWRINQFRTIFVTTTWIYVLGAEGTDRVVESHRIRCSHFDAFRFFMPQAGCSMVCCVSRVGCSSFRGAA